MAARKRSEAEWRSLVEEWQNSGLSRRAFATLRGISVATFSWWAWRLRAPGTDDPPEFLDVVVVDRAVEVPDLLVELGRLRVRVPAGFDAGELRRLVDALC